MDRKVLNYRVIIEKDSQTGTKKSLFTALCPTLGVADDGHTMDEALKNLRGAMRAYLQSLIDDGEEVPVDKMENEFITTTQIDVTGSFKVA